MGVTYKSKLNDNTIEISQLCMQSYPCQHSCKITTNGNVTECNLRSFEIYEWFKKNNYNHCDIDSHYESRLAFTHPVVYRLPFSIRLKIKLKKLKKMFC